MKQIKSFLRNLLIAALLVFSVASCSRQEEVYNELAAESGSWTAIKATYTYSIPDEMLRYADITVCYNVDDFTDAEWLPMEEETFSVDYYITKADVYAPVVLVYKASNRLTGKVTADWTITMKLRMEFYNGGEIVKEVNREYVHEIHGSAYSGIWEMINNVHLRTYSIIIDRHKNVSLTPGD